MTIIIQNDGARHVQRDRAVAEIEKKLASGPMTRESIAAELGLNPSTAASYLRHMHQGLRIIRKAQRLPDNRVLWELGEDLTLPDETDVAQHTVPAEQVGMWRDPLVGALFGPARQTATTQEAR